MYISAHYQSAHHALVFDYRLVSMWFQTVYSSYYEVTRFSGLGIEQIHYEYIMWF